MPEMTELERGEIIREWLSLLQGQGSLISADSTNLITILSGFLLLTYFVGKSLSKTQLVTLIALYVTVFVTSVTNIAGNSLASIAMKAPLVDVCPECEFSPLISLEGVVLTIIVNTALLAASLFFMWSVRHPKTE